MTRTAWENSAAADGSTDSERTLTKLAKKAFLSLWSYSNVFTDEGRRSGKGDGKELCDLLVVFGRYVLIFSDKHCEFPTHPDLSVAWPRWYRRAIEKSARQLGGAEGFLRKHPGRVFLDKDCRTPLPIAIPSADEARYFLFAVTRGAHAMAHRFFGQDCSGSLILNNAIEGDLHFSIPFQVGFPLADRRFVHVLDEVTAEILLSELNTLPDLISYLEAKEALLGSTDAIVTVSGEEDLVARYQMTFKNGLHSLPTKFSQGEVVAFTEGNWKNYSQSAQRTAKLEADAPSHLWDQMIEYQSRFIRAGTAIGLPDIPTKSDDHEKVVRAMAQESRMSRRRLARDLTYALQQSVPGQKFARISLSNDERSRAYVFLTAPPLRGVSYGDYRRSRTAALMTYCYGLKLKLPYIKEVIGIASEPSTEPVSSQEFIHVDLDFDPSEEDVAAWNEAMLENSVLGEKLTARFHHEQEFPVPFHPPSAARPDGAPNRKERRARAARARSKKR